LPYLPPCGVSANILVDLPGEVTIFLTPFFAGGYEVGSAFASTPLPEPGTSVLLLLAGALSATLLARKKE
jgi:hypothetical protein